MANKPDIDTDYWQATRLEKRPIMDKYLVQQKSHDSYGQWMILMVDKRRQKTFAAALELPDYQPNQAHIIIQGTGDLPPAVQSMIDRDLGRGSNPDGGTPPFSPN